MSIIGIVQEQHAERARLYRQWRQFDWPILQDSLNLLKVKVVPIAVAIDENGVVRSHQATPEFLASWLETAPGDIATEADRPPVPDLDKARSIVKFQAMADSDGVDQAIDIYEKLLAGDYSGDAAIHFEAGVAYRDRFDIAGNASDFQKAIDHWSRALRLDPNQYIYRRRIQQYGARLGKPYPFYDWVEQAQAEIRQRGDEPVELRVGLSGAEIAKPVRRFAGTSQPSDNPDPDDQIQRDSDSLVDVQVVAVPTRVSPGAAARVHVIFKPSAQAKWNNEAGPLVVWLEASDGTQLSEQRIELPLPGQAESDETRSAEFEVRLSGDASAPATVNGFALFNVCRNDSGTCLYLRRDFQVVISPDN